MNDTTAADTSPGAGQRPGEATLYIMLSRGFGSGIDYYAQTGELSENCWAEGYTEGKRCRVTFCRSETDHLSEFAHKHGLGEACGIVDIAPRLKSETFDDDGIPLTLPLINIRIDLDDSSYDRTEKLLRSCIVSGQEASLSICFSHRDFTRLFMRLDDLDLATKCIYPVVSFSLNSAHYVNTAVCVPKYKYDAATRAGLCFTATAASIQASVWRSKFSISKIELMGRLESSRLGVSLDDCMIDITEYKAGKWGYPEEAFPGVVTVSRKEAITYCGMELYATEDILARLVSLLAGMSKGDTVRFDVSMIAEGLPLKEGEVKYFDVTSYTPVLLKSYS